MRLVRFVCIVAAAGSLTAQKDGIPTVGVLPGDPLTRLGVKAQQLKDDPGGGVRFLRKSRYLSNRRAVVTHTLDDTSKFVPPRDRGDRQIRTEGDLLHQHGARERQGTLAAP